MHTHDGAVAVEARVARRHKAGLPVVLVQHADSRVDWQRALRRRDHLSVEERRGMRLATCLPPRSHDVHFIQMAFSDHPLHAEACTRRAYARRGVHTACICTPRRAHGVHMHAAACTRRAYARRGVHMEAGAACWRRRREGARQCSVLKDSHSCCCCCRSLTYLLTQLTCLLGMAPLGGIDSSSTPRDHVTDG